MFLNYFGYSKISGPCQAQSLLRWFNIGYFNCLKVILFLFLFKKFVAKKKSRVRLGFDEFLDFVFGLIIVYIDILADF